MDMITKNRKIAETRKATRNRRLDQVCKVYECKVDMSKLSIVQEHQLEMMFVEARWIWNYILNQDEINPSFDIFKAYYKDHPTITHYNKDHDLVEHHLEYCSCQIKDDLFKKPSNAIKNLSKAKKKGIKVGHLKYKSECNCIPLHQFNSTHKINKEHNCIKLQGVKKSIKVYGLHQIPKDAEIANASLIKKPDGYYFKITTFQKPQVKEKTNKSVGLDFGIKDNIIDSEGNKYNWNFPEPKRLKRHSRRMNKRVKGSKNRYKSKKTVAIEYQHLKNKKQDAIKKFVSKTVKDNDFISIQDENIHEWKSSKMKGWGRKIQHSIMGGIISELKLHSETQIVDKWFPSTQYCSSCGEKIGQKLGLDDRIYTCEFCHKAIDRDINSARNILIAGLIYYSRSLKDQIPMEHREFKPDGELYEGLDEKPGDSRLEEAGSQLSLLNVDVGSLSKPTCFSRW